MRGESREQRGLVPGSCPDFEDALRLVNGVMALVSDLEDLEPFVKEVWDFPTPKGEARYYQGLLQLYALMVLSGRMRVL